MRYFILSVLVLLTTDIIAQDSIDILPKQRKNEIGFLSDIGLNNTYNSSIGIQYKRWVKDNKKAIRANVSYTKYTQFDDKIFMSTQGDTVISKQPFTDIPTVYGAIGIEMQRHFYKSMYMYAAIDLYSAYGSGRTEDFIRKEITTNYVTESLDYYSVGATYPTSVFSIGLLPVVGVKFQFSRISFGTELSGIMTEYKSVNYGNTRPSPGGIADFNMGVFTQRIFASFRF